MTVKANRYFLLTAWAWEAAKSKKSFQLVLFFGSWWGRDGGHQIIFTVTELVRKREARELVSKGVHHRAHLQIRSRVFEHLIVYGWKCMWVSYHSSLLSGGLVLPIRHPEVHSLVLKESWAEARGDGGTLSAPSGGRMQQHNLPFVCARFERVFVRLHVNLETAEEAASSDDSTMLCLGRPPSISLTKIGDLAYN